MVCTNNRQLDVAVDHTAVDSNAEWQEASLLFMLNATSILRAAVTRFRYPASPLPCTPPSDPFRPPVRCCTGTIITIFVDVLSRRQVSRRHRIVAE